METNHGFLSNEPQTYHIYIFFFLWFPTSPFVVNSYKFRCIFETQLSIFSQEFLGALAITVPVRVGSIKK